MATASKPRKARKLTVACAQMDLSADLDQNLDRVVSLLRQAAKQHRAKVVVFPETALSGYAPVHWPDGFQHLDFARLAEYEQVLRDLAGKLNVYVILGTTIRERVKSETRFFNSALLLGEDGLVIGRYDKLHLMGTANGSLDAAHYQPGSVKRLKPYPILGGVKLGMQICLDMRYPEGWRSLALQGARLLAHPTFTCGRADYWKTPAIEANLSSRASENDAWVLSANAAGPFQWQTSRILDPDGLVIAEAERERTEVISATLHPDDLGRMPFLPTRRTDLNPRAK